MGQKGLRSLLVLSLPVFSGDITSGDITKFLACHDFAAWNFCRLQYRRTKDFHFEIAAGFGPSRKKYFRAGADSRLTAIFSVEYNSCDLGGDKMMEALQPREATVFF